MTLSMCAGPLASRPRHSTSCSGSLEDLPPDLKGRRLKEALGHTPFQVLMGALLGISVGLLTLLWK